MCDFGYTKNIGQRRDGAGMLAPALCVYSDRIIDAMGNGGEFGPLESAGVDYTTLGNRDYGVAPSTPRFVSDR